MHLTRIKIMSAAICALSTMSITFRNSPSERDARIVTAAYVDASEAALHPSAVASTTDHRQILLDSSDLRVTGFVLLRARLMMHSGGPYFLLAAGRGVLFRLGGFPDPEPAPFWTALPLRWKSSHAPRAWATLLARVLDSHGNRSIIHSIDTTDADKAITAAWEQSRPSQWPTDTTLALANGTIRVCVTALSPSDEVETPGIWRAISFTFTFDHERRLRAWAMHEGKQFMAPSR